MGKLAIVLMFFGASVCVQAQITATGGGVIEPNKVSGSTVRQTEEQPCGVDILSKPCEKEILHCEKYQHQQYTPAHCANTCDPESSICTTGCLYVPADNRCVEDVHVVYEREWQAWMYVQKTQQDVNEALRKYILANEAKHRITQARLKVLEAKAKK